MIEIVVQHDFGGFALDVQFAAQPGVTALFGRSGAGKTSVINAVAGLFRPARCRIIVDGKRLDGLPVYRRGIGYVFQDALLFPNMSVLQNLRYGGQVAEAEVIELLGIGQLLDRRPADLSGGERQRVAIGRALMSDPALLLMDEPLAALDAARKDEILPYLARLRDEARVPMLYVSHSLSEVAQLANAIVVLEAGRVVGHGPVDDVLSDPGMVPHLGVRDAGAVLTGQVAGEPEDGLTQVDVPGGALFLPGKIAGANVRVRIAAQDVILSRERPVGLSALNILSGRISALRSGDGPGVMVQVDLGQAHVLARITGRSARAMDLQIGQPVHAVIKTVSVAPGDIGAVGNGLGQKRDSGEGPW